MRSAAENFQLMILSRGRAPGEFLVFSLLPGIGRAKVSLAVTSGRSNIYLGGYGLARTCISFIACLIFAVGLDAC